MRPTIQEIKDYVYTHIGDIHTIEDIARPFQTSSDALHMTWKRSGERTSLKKFVTKVRIQAAGEWHQQHPQALCKEIAFGIGLRTLDAGSRCFKRVTGQSMKEHFGRD